VTIRGKLFGPLRYCTFLRPYVGEHVS
jgi:hypothetical protein